MNRGSISSRLRKAVRSPWVRAAVVLASLVLLISAGVLWVTGEQGGAASGWVRTVTAVITGFWGGLLLSMVSYTVLSGRQRRRAAGLIEEERQQLRSIFDSIDEPIYVADPQSHELLYANAALKRKWGDKVGQPCFRVLQGLDAPCEFCTNSRILGENVGKTHVWEFQDRTDGSWYRCIDKAIHWPDGRMVRYEMAIDITDRKKTEAALQQQRDFAESLIETAQTIVLVLDTEARIVRFNPYMEQVTGYRQEEVQGLDWFNTFLPECDREWIRGIFRNAVDDIPARGNVNPIMTKDGREREIEWHSKTLKDSEGLTLGVLAVGQDITERRRAEAEAQQRQAELEHLHRLNTISEFASGLAHELNQPLCAISSNVQAALIMLRKEGQAADDVSTALQQATGQAERAAEIIRRLRNLVGKHELTRGYTDINKVIQGAVAFAQAEARRHEITIGLNLAESLPPVCIDEVQIQQVILNLTRNAIEAILEGGNGRREVILSTSGTDGGVEVAVRDSGCGLPPGEVEQLFRSFFTTKRHGLGLGLSLSRSLIEAHNGRLWASPNPGRGATFRFTLPVEDGVTDHANRTDCVCR